MLDREVFLLGNNCNLLIYIVQIDGKELLCYVSEHVAVIMHKSQEELNSFSHSISE